MEQSTYSLLYLLSSTDKNSSALEVGKLAATLPFFYLSLENNCGIIANVCGLQKINSNQSHSDPCESYQFSFDFLHLLKKTKDCLQMILANFENSENMMDRSLTHSK